MNKLTVFLSILVAVIVLLIIGLNLPDNTAVITQIEEEEGLEEQEKLEEKVSSENLNTTQEVEEIDTPEVQIQSLFSINEEISETSEDFVVAQFYITLNPETVRTNETVRIHHPIKDEFITLKKDRAQPNSSNSVTYYWNIFDEQNTPFQGQTVIMVVTDKGVTGSIPDISQQHEKFNYSIHPYPSKGRHAHKFIVIDGSKMPED